MASEAPELGWTTSGIVSRVIDGDTVEVTVSRVIRVRLQDCWAPEAKRDPRLSEIERDAAKFKGQAAKEHLRQIADGRECVLQIPTHTEDGTIQDMSDSLSLERVIGRVWVKAGNLAEIQVERGYATRTKGGL